jgi:hypothetical protein
VTNEKREKLIASIIDPRRKNLGTLGQAMLAKAKQS